ncbi:hypothetical protein Mapa_015814 [Marchantia paleacea]|nr:hypothetical protein Mapa_015814 [Marchantia paleacea]
MRSFRVTKASRPALRVLKVGPLSRKWTPYIFEDLKVLGCRRSTPRTCSRQHLQIPTSKRWVFIAGEPPTFTKSVKLCRFNGAVQYSSGSSGRSGGGRRKDPSLLYGAGWEGSGEDVAVAVWWDFENCNVPQGIEVYKVGVNIVSGLRLSGFKGPVSISAYGDTVQLSRTTQEALAATGIRLHHIPSGGKDSSDRALLVDLILWTLEHPPPAHLFLISGDRDFSNALHRLRMRNYNILLACPAGTTVSPALLGAATHVWQWNSLVRGEGLLLATSPYVPPDGSPGGVSYSRHGVPRPYTPNYYPVSRSSDGNAHSAEGGGMPTPPSTLPSSSPSSVQSRAVEANGSSVSVVKKPTASPVSPAQSTQKQVVKDTTSASVVTEGGATLSSNVKPILRRPPQKLLQKFKCLLSSHPNGMMLADLQNYIREGKLNLEKDFYGHGKVVPFLSSIPEIVQLDRVLMKDNKSWSYILLTPSQDSIQGSSEGSNSAEEVGGQTQSYRQANEQTPAASVIASRASSHPEVEALDSTSHMKQEKLDSPGLSKFLQSDTRDRGKDEKVLHLQANGSSSDRSSGSETQDSVSKSDRTVNVSEASPPTFLRSLVDALKNLQTKRIGVEDPNSQQQVDADLTKRYSAVEQVTSLESRSTSIQDANEGTQFSIPDTSSKRVRGGFEADASVQLEETAEASIKERTRVDASNLLSADNQLVSNGPRESSKGLTNDSVGTQKINNLESDFLESAGPRSSSTTEPPAMEKYRRTTWKRWLFGPTTEEASSTSGTEFRASPELHTVSRSDAVSSSLGREEAKADSEVSHDSVTTPGEVTIPQPTVIGTTDGRNEDFLWGHSFVNQNSKSDASGTMKVCEELKEYISSAEGTLLLSDASNLMEAVNYIRMKGPLQFRYLDSNQISDILRPLAEANGGIQWERLNEALSTDGSVSVSDSNDQLKAQVLDAHSNELHHPSGESLREHAAGSLVESKNKVDHDFQHEGKLLSNESRSVDRSGSVLQKKELDENARSSLEEGVRVSVQEASQNHTGPNTVVSLTHLYGASSKITASPSHSTSSTTFINETQAVHPTFEEFEEWFLRVVNNAYKRVWRNQRAGYDLSLVKPDFEREFGVRLDPKGYGFSRVQDLVASIGSVRLSRPRIDQCVIHLLKFDAEASERANQSHEEQVDETNASALTKSQIWPKMFHDCRTLVRELMLENPDGVAGVRLKPLFVNKYNYPLDHRRVGYQRLSDLLRLMSDLVSVNGNFLVPSEEFLRTLREEEKAGDGVPQNVIIDAGIDSSLNDEFSSDTLSQIGENWSEIDKEANGSLSSEYTDGQLPEDGQESAEEQAFGPRAFEKLSTNGEVLHDLCSTSEDESDLASEASEDVDSQAEQFQSFVEKFQKKELRRTTTSHVSGDKEARGSTRSFSPSREYDFSQEIDKLLLDDDHMEQWMAENRTEETQEDVDSISFEGEDTREADSSALDGHLHEDWSTELMKDDIEDSDQQRNDDLYADGAGVSGDEEASEVVHSRCQEQTQETSRASEEHETFVQDSAMLGSGITSRDGLAPVTSNAIGQRQQDVNAKSSELRKTLRRKEEPSEPINNPYFSVPPQVDSSLVTKSQKSMATTAEEPTEETRESDTSSRDTDVYCYTPSSDGAHSSSDNSLKPVTSNMEEDKSETKVLTSNENAEDISSKDKSRKISQDVQEGDNIGGSSSSEVATSKSIWRRLFK